MAINQLHVSHVIPSLNQGRFLARCIDSCLAQCDGANEIIVVDGGSTDETADRLAGYDDRVQWTSKPDLGQADAVNKGVARARGDIIAWINADDFYPRRDILERVVETFGEDSRLDIVYGDGLRVDAWGRPIRPHLARRIRRPADILIAPSSFAMQPAVFFRKKLFVRCGGLRPELHWAPDYDFWLRAFPLARATCYLPGALAYATYHPGAKSVHGMLSQIRQIRAIKRHYAKRFALGLADRARVQAGVASLYLYLGAVKLGLRRVT